MKTITRHLVLEGVDSPSPRNWPATSLAFIAKHQAWCVYSPMCYLLTGRNAPAQHHATAVPLKVLVAGTPSMRPSTATMPPPRRNARRRPRSRVGARQALLAGSASIPKTQRWVLIWDDHQTDGQQCSRTLPACDSCAGLGRKCRYHNRRHAPDTLQALGELKIRQDSSNIPLPPNWVRVIHSDIYDSLAQASLQEARSWPQIQAISEDFARADAASSAVYIILPAHIAGTKATPSPSATATPSGPIEPNWDVGSSTFSLSQDRPPSLPPNWLPLNDVWAATVLCTLGTPVHERSEWDSQVQAAYEESRGRDDGSSRFTAYALLHRFAESASVPGPLDTEPQSECGSESESESEFEVEYESEDRG